MYIRKLTYKKGDVDCKLCTEYRGKKHPCPHDVCPFIAERIEAGAVTYWDAVNAMISPQYRFARRLPKLAVEYPGTFFLDDRHRSRMEFLNTQLGYVPGRNTPAYYAAMYLLTANEIIYWRMANCFCRDGIDFRYAILRGISTYSITFTNTQYGRIQIVKTTNTGSHLGGWTFQVRDSSGKTVGEFTTDESGYAITGNLPLGRYTVMELPTEDVYWIGELGFHTVLVTGGKDAVDTWLNKEQGIGWFYKKTNTGENVEGWKITIYSDPACTQEVGTITTNEEGRGGYYLDPGIYYAKETGDEYGRFEDEYWMVDESVQKMVVSTTDPFLVSVPMTSVNGTNANDGGTRWIYDITLYPKNLTGIPSLEKTLRESKNDTGKNDAYAHTGTASAGDTIDYQIISTLPSITSEATYLSCYTFIDTLSAGLTYTKGDVTLEIFSDTACKNAVTTWKEADGYFTVSYNDADGKTAMTVEMTAKGLAEINKSKAVYHRGHSAYGRCGGCTVLDVQQKVRVTPTPCLCIPKMEKLYHVAKSRLKKLMLCE